MHAYYAMGMESKKDGREKEKERKSTICLSRAIIKNLQ